MTQYQYRPLNPLSGEIRLLTLKCGHLEDPIECELQHVSTSEALPRYETVSYCWGDGAASKVIQTNDCLLTVPQSTAEVLRRFRNSDRTRTLWIDAVCINQADLQERSTQVTKMHMIYASAVQNLIWLGQDDGSTEEGVTTTNILIKEIEQETESFKTLPFSGGPNFYLHRSSGLKQDYTLEPILELLSKPWFGRLWVVQEASLAATNIAHCGSHSFDLLNLLRVAKWIWTKREHLDLGPYADAQRVLGRAWRMSDFVDRPYGWFHQARSKGWFRIGEVSLARHMLTELRNFDCSQLIDHVYGIVGMYRDFSGAWLPDLLRPDYSKCVTEAFINATRQSILETNDLVVLHDIYHRIEDDVGRPRLPLPSWVPQWHQPWNLKLDPTPLHRGYKASGEWTLDSIGSIESGSREIKLEGTFVDGKEGSRVEILTERFLENAMTRDFLNSVQDLVNGHPLIGRNEDKSKAIATVLCAEESAERELVTADDLLGYDELKEYFAIPFIVRPNLSIRDHPPGLKRAARYAEAAWRACYRRKFFITAAGRLGIGPQTMEVGDVVTILYGGEWPFVLRPCGNQYYELVGLAYMYGIMGGQAVQEHEERGDGDVWFCIR